MISFSPIKVDNYYVQSWKLELSVALCSKKITILQRNNITESIGLKSIKYIYIEGSDLIIPLLVGSNSKKYMIFLGISS